jgi:predicted transcriptional regulator
MSSILILMCAEITHCAQLIDKHYERDDFLRHLLDLTTEKGPLSIVQLAKLLKTGARSRKLHYAIRTLTTLGVIRKEGEYYILVKQLLSNEDYELAIEHSEKLLRIGGFQVFGLDDDVMMKSAGIIDSVLESESAKLKEYLKEIFAREIRLGKKTSNSPDITKSIFSEYLREGFPSQLNDHLKSGYLKEVWQPLQQMIDYWNGKRTAELASSYSGLRKELVFLVERVAHGTPLEGACNLCPAKYIRMIDRKRVPGSERESGRNQVHLQDEARDSFKSSGL